MYHLFVLVDHVTTKTINVDAEVLWSAGDITASITTSVIHWYSSASDQYSCSRHTDLTSRQIQCESNAGLAVLCAVELDHIISLQQAALGVDLMILLFDSFWQALTCTAAPWCLVFAIFRRWLCRRSSHCHVTTLDIIYTVFRKKHPLTFSFISPWIICGFKQKLQ